MDYFKDCHTIKAFKMVIFMIFLQNKRQFEVTKIISYVND